MKKDCLTSTMTVKRPVRQLQPTSAGLSLDRMSSYIADNGAVNFGKHNSMFQKPKQLHKQLIEVG